MVNTAESLLSHYLHRCRSDVNKQFSVILVHLGWVKSTDNSKNNLKAVELQCFVCVLCHKIVTYSGILPLQYLPIFVKCRQDLEKIFNPPFLEWTNDSVKFLPFPGFSYRIWSKYQKTTNIFFKIHL